jgi:hypothetical protein
VEATVVVARAVGAKEEDMQVVVVKGAGVGEPAADLLVVEMEGVLVEEVRVAVGTVVASVEEGTVVEAMVEGETVAKGGGAEVARVLLLV